MVSACLAGENCKYNGGNNRTEKVLQLMAENGFRCIDVEDLEEIHDDIMIWKKR